MNESDMQWSNSPLIALTRLRTKGMNMPHILISDSAVDAIPAQLSGQSVYRDAVLRGFAVRVGTERKTYFVERKMIGRKMVRCNIGVHRTVLPDGRTLTAEV